MMIRKIAFGWEVLPNGWEEAEDAEERLQGAFSVEMATVKPIPRVPGRERQSAVVPPLNRRSKRSSSRPK